MITTIKIPQFRAKKSRFCPSAGNVAYNTLMDFLQDKPSQFTTWTMHRI